MYCVMLYKTPQFTLCMLHIALASYNTKHHRDDDKSTHSFYIYTRTGTLLYTTSMDMAKVRNNYH